MGRSHRNRMAVDQRLYLNGTAAPCGGSVGAEDMCDAPMLDECHIMHADDVTTPLRQLYFCVQLLLIDSDRVEEVWPMLDEVFHDVGRVYEDTTIARGVRSVGVLLERGRYFAALLAVGAMFEQEQALQGEASCAVRGVRG